MVTQDQQTDAYKNKVEMFTAMAELRAKEKAIHVSQGYGKAYLWSVLFPPIGIYYFIKYIFLGDGTQEAFKAGVVALVLTLISLFVSLWMLGGMFSQAAGGSSQATQMINNLAVPANQKELIQIMK